MRGQTSDAFSPAARRLSRRTSLAGAAGAALGLTLARAPRVEAGKVGRKAKRACRKQTGMCESSVTEFCAGVLPFSQEACEAALLTCCQSFKGCDAGDAFTCLTAGLDDLIAPPE
jgi:hypothetical protein